MSTLAQKSARKEIPKPKAIPRLTRSKAENAKKIAEVKTRKPDISANKENAADSKKLAKIASSRGNEDGLIPRKKITNDRRGISEIKRSESNLQERILALENELAETKQTLLNANYNIQEKTEKVFVIEQELRISKSENQGLIDLLENEVIDPVSKTKRNISSELKSLMDLKKENSECEVQEILHKLRNISSECKSPLHDIQSLNFKFDFPE